MELLYLELLQFPEELFNPGVELKTKNNSINLTIRVVSKPDLELDLVVTIIVNKELPSEPKIFNVLTKSEKKLSYEKLNLLRFFLFSFIRTKRL